MLAENFEQEERRRVLSYDLSEGNFVQFSYNGLRTQDGGEMGVEQHQHSDLWFTNDGKIWSDVIIAFEADEVLDGGVHRTSVYSQSC